MQLNLVTVEDFNQLKSSLQQISTKIEEIQMLQLSSEILTNEKLSELLNVSPRTLQNYRDKGLIKFSQVGRKIFYTVKEVNHFLENNKI